MKLTKEEVHEIIKKNLDKLEIYPRVKRKIERRNIGRKDIEHCLLYGVTDSIEYERKGIIVEIRLGSLKKRAKRPPLIGVIFLQLTEMREIKTLALMSSYRRK